MRNLLPSLSLSLVLAGAGSLPAASLSVANAGGPYVGNDLAVTSSAGAVLSTGFFAVFQFSSAPATFADLKANGDTGIMDSLGLSGGNYPGGGSLFTSFNIPNVTGADLYFVVGDGSDVASSNELAMMDITGHAPLTGFDPQALGTYQLLEGDVLIGTVGTGTYDWTSVGGPAAYGTKTLQLIPEPGTSLLGLLGLTVLLRRRR